MAKPGKLNEPNPDRNTLQNTKNDYLIERGVQILRDHGRHVPNTKRVCLHCGIRTYE